MIKEITTMISKIVIVVTDQYQNYQMKSTAIINRTVTHNSDVAASDEEV